MKVSGFITQEHWATMPCIKTPW